MTMNVVGRLRSRPSYARTENRITFKKIQLIVHSFCNNEGEGCCKDRSLTLSIRIGAISIGYTIRNARIESVLKEKGLVE